MVWKDLKLLLPCANCDLFVCLRKTVTKPLGFRATSARFPILGFPKLLPELKGTAVNVNIAAVFMGSVPCSIATTDVSAAR